MAGIYFIRSQEVISAFRSDRYDLSCMLWLKNRCQFLSIDLLRALDELLDFLPAPLYGCR